MRTCHQARIQIPGEVGAVESAGMWFISYKADVDDAVRGKMDKINT